MGLFKALTDIALMPVRIAVDVVTLPKNMVEGDHLAPTTSDGLKKLVRDLNED